MKKFTLVTLLMLIATFAFAQKSSGLMPAKNLLTKQAPSSIQGVQLKLNTTMARKAPRKGPELVKPEGEEEAWYLADGVAKQYQSSANDFVNITDALLEEYGGTMGVIINKDKVYIKGLNFYYPDAWIEGELSGSTVTFASGQFVGALEEDGETYEFYINCFDWNTNKLCKEIVFEYDEKEGTLTQDYYTAMLLADDPKSTSAYGYWDEMVLSKEAPLNPEVVPEPFGLGEDWVVVGCPIVESEEEEGMYELDTENAEQFLTTVKIIDNEFYIQGLSRFLPEAWLKGTIEGDKVTFATNQYFGPYEVQGNTYDLFFVNYNIDDQVVEDFVMTYDKEKEQLLNADEKYWMVTTVSKPKISNMVDLYFIYSITKYVEDGISTINNNKSNAVYYNLQGARMDKPTQKGIYIRNGKKMVVK
ncbi:MAG: hypothetical protein J5506_02345 [Prevotella sp.]|nr:hypothetical protein [Prevotella sp.]